MFIVFCAFLRLQVLRKYVGEDGLKAMGVTEAAAQEVGELPDLLSTSTVKDLVSVSQSAVDASVKVAARVTGLAVEVAAIGKVHKAFTDVQVEVTSQWQRIDPNIPGVPVFVMHCPRFATVQVSAVVRSIARSWRVQSLGASAPLGWRKVQ